MLRRGSSGVVVYNGFKLAGPEPCQVFGVLLQELELLGGEVVPQPSDLRAGCLVKHLLCAFALLHEAGHVVRLLFFLSALANHSRTVLRDPGLPCDTGGAAPGSLPRMSTCWRCCGVYVVRPMAMDSC